MREEPDVRLLTVELPGGFRALLVTAKQLAITATQLAVAATQLAVT